MFRRTARRGWIAVYATRSGEARSPFPAYRKHDEEVNLERGLASKIRDMVVDRDVRVATEGLGVLPR